MYIGTKNMSVDGVMGPNQSYTRYICTIKRDLLYILKETFKDPLTMDGVMGPNQSYTSRYVMYLTMSHVSYI